MSWRRSSRYCSHRKPHSMAGIEQPRSPRSAEHARLADSSPDTPGNWKAIGPYVSERAWGTVREDYSADGQAWQYFPYEHARSRAYRWNEDGLAGLSDRNAAPLFRIGLLERARSVPQGTHLWALRPGRKSRRGRKGVLVVHRCNADGIVAALALPLPAGRVSLRVGFDRRTQGATRTSPNSS